MQRADSPPGNRHINNRDTPSSGQGAGRERIMPRSFVTPSVVVSRCIEFDHCRWNGEMVTSHVVEQLKDFVDFIPV
jgi:hypothetical protein